ncbi:hypothetical protein NUSPORA_01124 [Nucleospora cyclopteri]
MSGFDELLEKFIIQERTDINFLLKILPICNYKQLDLIISVSQKSKKRNEIFNEIQNLHSEIKIVKSKDKPRILPRSKYYSKDKIENWIDSKVKHFNSRGIRFNIVDEKSKNYIKKDDLIKIIKSKKLDDIGCKNILKFTCNEEINLLIYKNYQNLEFIRCKLFNVTDFSSFLIENQYIYVATNKDMVIERLKSTQEKIEINNIIIKRMLESKNETRRHFGYILANFFQLEEFFNIKKISEEKNKTIRKFLFDKKEKIFNIVDFNLDRLKSTNSSEYELSIIEILNSNLKTVFENEINRFFNDSSKIKITDNLKTDQTTKKMISEIFSNASKFPGFMKLLSKLNLEKSPVNSIKLLFFDKNDSIKTVELDGCMQKDWNIVKEFVNFSLKNNLTDEIFDILLNIDHYGLILYCKEIITKNKIKPNKIKIINLIDSLDKNTRKSGGVGAYFAIIDVPSAELIEIYCKSKIVHVKFHILNILIANLQRKKLDIFDKEVFYNCNLKITKELLQNLKINGENTLKSDFIKYAAVCSSSNNSIAVADSISIYLWIAFDALLHSHFSVKNGGISLFCSLLQKILCHQEKIACFFEFAKLRDFIYSKKDLLPFYVLKIYEILPELTGREIKFIEMTAKCSSAEGIKAKRILSKRINKFEKTEYEIKFNEKIKKPIQFYYLLKILNNYDEKELEAAKKYLNVNFNIKEEYEEKYRIKTCEYINKTFSNEERLVIKELLITDKDESCDFNYEINLLNY